MSIAPETPAPIIASEPARSENAWRKRSFGAFIVKAIAFLVPLAVSVAYAIFAGRQLAEPVGLGGHVVWWLIVLGGAIAVAMLVERLARRLLPMAMLLKLSLVFPETAPSRFGMALRANSTRQLKRRIEAGVIDENATPHEAATALLELTAALGVHDRMTRGHAERVRAYAMMIGEQLDLPEDDLQMLQWGALLHDVGKLDVDSNILNKPGAPDAAELASLRAHPDQGRKYVAPLVDWLGEWSLPVSQHHERYDGKGYPEGLEGEDISLAARIVSVADSFDVMTSTRSYKVAMEPQDARAELHQNSHTQFDPHVVRAFLSVPVSELRRPFQAALGAGVVASIAQRIDARMIGTAAIAAAGALASIAPGTMDIPSAIAFSDNTPDVVEIVEDRPLEIPLRTTVVADSYSVDSVDGPATATIDQDILTIKPMAEESGTVTVVITACSGSTCDSTAIVAEIIALNDPPAAGADEATIGATQDSISIPVLANDTDVDDTDLFVRSAELTIGNGVVTVTSNGQEILFTPEPGSIGPWMIEYVVADNDDGFDSGTVTILDGDLAPEAVDDRATVIAGQTITIDVRANDLDDGGASRLEVVEANIVSPEGTQTSVAIDDDQNLVFVAGPDIEVVIVEYTVRDRMVRNSSARVLLAVTPPIPVAVDDATTIEQDSSATVDVLANDGPAILDLSTVTLRVVSSSEGAVSTDGRNITYTPPENSSGEAAVTYEICAAEDRCDTATLSITVNAAVSPFAAEGQIVLPADAGPQLIPWVVVSSGGTTVEPGTNFAISTDRPGLFTVRPSISQSGTLTFTPAPTASGTARTIITVTDSSGTRRYQLSIIIT